MITAKEAKCEMEKYLKGRAKINKVLDFLDGVIRIACRNGEDHVFVKENSFNSLSSEQMEVVIVELADLGYKINPIYETNDAIQMACKVGYNIEW
jgi:hypothetical protein